MHRNVPGRAHSDDTVLRSQFMKCFYQFMALACALFFFALYYCLLKPNNLSVMKNFIDEPQQPAPLQLDACSEQKCITCFENRGCIYDQFPIVLSNDRETFYQESSVQTGMTNNR